MFDFSIYYFQFWYSIHHVEIECTIPNINSVGIQDYKFMLSFHHQIKLPFFSFPLPMYLSHIFSFCHVLFFFLSMATKSREETNTSISLWQSSLTIFSESGLLSTQQYQHCLKNKAYLLYSILYFTQHHHRWYFR